MRKVKPISMDVLGDKKLTLGIRRQSGDSDGNKYQANVHSTMFEDPQHDGKIESFSRAAALEGQVGRHKDKIIFDRKAVVHSVKQFL